MVAQRDERYLIQHQKNYPRSIPVIDLPLWSLVRRFLSKVVYFTNLIVPSLARTHTHTQHSLSLSGHSRPLPLCWWGSSRFSFVHSHGSDLISYTTLSPVLACWRWAEALSGFGRVSFYRQKGFPPFSLSTLCMLYTTALGFRLSSRPWTWSIWKMLWVTIKVIGMYNQVILRCSEVLDFPGSWVVCVMWERPHHTLPHTSGPNQESPCSVECKWSLCAAHTEWGLGRDKLKIFSPMFSYWY